MRAPLWGRSNHVVLVWLLGGFDLSTAAGRSHERYRRIALTALASAGARSIGIAATLVSVPLAVGYLGTERYGLWATLSSVIVMLGVADLGLGYGLVNAVSQAHGRDDREAVRRNTSSAFYLLTATALLLGAMFALSYLSIPWSTVFNLSSAQAAREAGPAAAALVGCFLLGLPLAVAQRVQWGYQEGFASSLWVGLGSVLTLGGIALAVWTRAGLPWLVLAAAGGPVISSFLNSVVLFGIRRPWLRPSFAFVSSRATKALLRTGMLFMVLQAAMVVGYQSDSLVIAQVLGPAEVTQYAVPLKLFLPVSLLSGFAVAPLWPAYSEAIAHGDIAWARKALLRSTAVSAAVALPATVLLVAFGRSLVHLWVGGRVTPSLGLLIGLGLWTVLSTVGGPAAIFLNAAGILRFQVVCALAMATVNLPLSIVLAHVMGVSGVVYATVIAVLGCEAVPFLIAVRRGLSALEHGWPYSQPTSQPAAVQRCPPR